MKSTLRFFLLLFPALCLNFLFLNLSALSACAYTSDYSADRIDIMRQELEDFKKIQRRVLISSELDKLSSDLSKDTAAAQSYPAEPPAHEQTTKTIAPIPDSYQPAQISYSEVMNDTKPQPVPSPAEESSPVKESPFGAILHGEVDLSIGLTSSDFYWKRANYDLYEKNWRILSNDGFNNGINTYDPGIYQRLQLELDVQPKESPVSAHVLIAVDPWSFTSKSDKITLDSSPWGDPAEIQFFGWENTGYTIGRTMRTVNGDTFNLPEMKIKGGKIDPVIVSTQWSNGVNEFSIPEMEMETTFQPIRELWFDYNPDPNFKLRVFPMAFEDQALITDDPLQLSGKKIYWENSPWTNSWKPGAQHNNVKTSYSPGKWDNSVAFYTRDSNAQRLTALRGISFEHRLYENTEILGTVATPKTLWQDYDEFDAIPMSFRVKHFVTENFYVGNVTGVHLGFNPETDLDAVNVANGIDFGFNINDTTKIAGEFAASRSDYDRTSDRFGHSVKGHAGFLEITNSSIANPQILEKDFFGLRPANRKNNPVSYRLTRLYASYMEEDFESSLSNFKNTRKDAFWSRHVHFRKPYTHFFAGSKDALTLDDIEPFSIGDGIDYGRQVVGFRNEVELPDYRLKNLFNVYSAFNTEEEEKDHIETVVRSEWDYQATDKLQMKLLGLYHALPKTTAGVDPFLYDSVSGEYLENSAIEDGKDPSAGTASLGGAYTFTQKIKAHAIWEYSNDINAGSDNFPRGILNSSWNGDDNEFMTNDQYYMITQSALYNQSLFDLPPYEYRNIFRYGLELTPSEKWNFYIDFTHNPNKFAGPVDGNMNHLGFEAVYLPTERLGILMKYVWSRWYDFEGYTTDFNGNGSVTQDDFRLNYTSHHAFFAELKYMIDPTSHFVAEYGVGPSMELKTMTFDPYGGSMPVIDTEHIVRLFYRKKF